VLLAHAVDGVYSCSAGHFDRLATGTGLLAGDPKIRIPFCRHVDVGPRGGTIRRVAFHLRHSNLLPDCVTYRCPAEHCDGGLFDRTRAALDPATDRVAHRNAGRDTQRNPWPMGNFRDDPVAARSSISVPATDTRVDSIFQRADLRPMHAGWRNHCCDYDSADYYVRL